MPDFDGPAVEEEWCRERREVVADYLEREGLDHGQIGDWRVWHIAPYVLIWAIESARRPGWLGWWAICGDLPTDYLSPDTVKHPREAMRGFSNKWFEPSDYLTRGIESPGVRIGAPDQGPELAPLLKDRAVLLAEWANDDAIWQEHAP